MDHYRDMDYHICNHGIYSMDRELETILADSPRNWTKQDYKVIAKAQKELGHKAVKSLRDELQDPPEEQIVS